MNKTTKENINKEFIRTLGISYDEYEKLDFDEQQKLIREYHKKNPSKEKETLVMIGGGDESIFIRVPKGKKILTPNGYIIAGETLEENKARWEQKINETENRWQQLNKRQTKEIRKKQRLDFKTWLYLYITHAIKVEHPLVCDLKTKRTMNVKDSKKNEVYIFNNYEEYRNFYLMYLNNIDDNIIDLAIYTRSSKGHIIALKRLCEHIIVKKKINEFYEALTPEIIEEIHSKGKLTPLEAVQLWESNNLCIEGSKTIHSKCRCDYFNYNCHECLMETASHKLEHDPIDFKITNTIKPEQGPIKKFVPKKDNNGNI